MKFTIISILILTFSYSCMKPTRLPENEVNSYIRKIDKTFNTPGFKGLHLGMGHNQVNELVKKTYWCYRKLGKRVDDPDYRNEVSMSSNISGPYEWLSIGSYGREGDIHYHYIDSVKVEYYNGQVVYIGLNGAMYSADEIDRYVKDWCKFAIDGLIKKYGSPTKIYKDIDRINIFDYETGYKIPMYYWTLGENEIVLTIDEIDSSFGCSVDYRNIDGVKELRKEKSESKHSF